jgi:hypothetical protein
MRVTEQVFDNEVVVRGWLTQQRAWVTWHDDRAKRERSTPTLIALHIPTHAVLAVYCRPRKLRPSEAPDVSWLPAGWVPVVWWPGMHKEVRAWLVSPDGRVPPGVVPTTRDGAK